MGEAHRGGLAGPAHQQPALGTGVCWQSLPSAVVAAGLDRRPLCPVSQHPVAKGRVEPVFPTAEPPLRVRQHSDSEGDAGVCP